MVIPRSLSKCHSGLDANALQHAWGLAASQVSGIIRNFGTMTKPFHAGHATRCGMFSAWMAREGFTADPNVLDGPDGIFATYGKVDGPTLERSLERLGSPWEMQDPGIYAKQWPCCYCNHRPVGGLLQLIEEHGIGIEEVTAISVGFLPGSDSSLVSENPRTGLEGKFSIEYAAAATLLDRKLTLDTFTDHMVQRPRIRELMKKVRRYRIEDSRIYSGVVGFTDVAVDTPRGTFKVRVDKTPGSPAWPLSSEARLRKFLDCSGRALGDEGAKRLLAIAHDLAALPDVGELLSATVPSGASASHTQGSASSSIA
jgi:2-methylcitrate dehydratase PrpD